MDTLHSMLCYANYWVCQMLSGTRTECSASQTYHRHHHGTNISMSAILCHINTSKWDIYILQLTCNAGGAG